MKHLLPVAMLLFFFLCGCAPSASVKQIGATSRKTYHTSYVPNARTAGYKPKGY